MFYEHGLTQKVVNLISNEQTRKFAILASAQLIKDNQNNRVQLISQSQSGTFIQLLSQENDHDLIVGILSILVVLGVDDEPYRKGLKIYRLNSRIFGIFKCRRLCRRLGRWASSGKLPSLSKVKFLRF